MKNLTFKRYDSLELLAIFTDDEWKTYRFFMPNVQKSWATYWWSFLKTLANLYANADYTNENKIVNNWYNYIEQFYNQWLLEPFDILDTNQK